MHLPSRKQLLLLGKLFAGFATLKFTAQITLGYGVYFPADFTSEFLHGRGGYFWDGYFIPFYVHILSGPVTLVLGVFLLSNRVRDRHPEIHRALGKLQIAFILLLLVPSGLWMAGLAEGGVIARAAFTSLALATGLFAWRGWRAAANRQFVAHQRWMMRCFLVLASAIVLRLMGGLFFVARIEGDWTYALAAWASWILPLLTYEAFAMLRHPTRVGTT